MDIYPGEMEVYLHTKTCAWTFVAALFIIASNRKQSGWPLMGEYLNCGTYIQCNKIHNKKDWTIDTHNSEDLQGIILSEKQKPVLKGYILHDSTSITFLNDKIIEIKK